jgi:16S rRNA A1518/A1519 N6-dimethyltransferase RsmA/KsgA/DIM1 with predicted DNA glycosylase/AP lyase activity
VPQVDSAFVHIKPIEKFDERFREYSRFLKRIFSYRRKNIRNVLRGLFSEDITQKILYELSLDSTLRCEDLHPATFKKIYMGFYIVNNNSLSFIKRK